MEFRLNKIDPELRRRIKETTSTRRVHTKSGIVIDKHSKNKKREGTADFSEELEKHKDKGKNRDKKFVSVEAVKSKELKVPAYREETADLAKDNLKGHILDVKK